MENIQSLFNSFFEKTINPQIDSDNHLTTMFGIAIQMRAKNVLELGVRWGTTTEPLLLGTYLMGGKITCVDIDSTQWKCPEFLKEHYKFIQSDAIKFLENEVKNGSYYDLIFIDDWHSYEHVKKELELVDKITDKKSIILLHDLMCGNHVDDNNQPVYSLPMWNGPESEFGEGGPTRAVFELDKEKWEWVTFPVCNGLTVLRKK